MNGLPPFETHAVDNQPPPFEPRDLWADDVALREAAEREGARDFVPTLAGYARLAGDELYRLGFDANRDKPRLKTHDRYGQRIDTVEFHPAYHRLMQAAKSHGVAGLSWHQAQPGGHVARAALSYLHHQVEAGTSCPLTMTHAAVPVLQREPALREWAAKAAAPAYDPRDVSIAGKAGITIGMGMTEKQGGSDVRGNATVATPLAGDGEYSLVGHKWFFSAPMCDGFLVLAQAPGGLSCLLLPRRLPDGSKNAFRLMRLKDKLGDWSNASSEVEFCGAWARRIGDEGRGVATIIEMVMLTRLDCMLGSAAEMRMALAQALHHARHRRTFGRLLVEHALMGNVLADLALESEAALALSMRVARAVDAAPQDPTEAAFARIATAVGKYWICKRAPAFVNEAQECLGGAGYVEESMLPRLYRQAPLNSIWEGSGNIQCLDVLRALTREPETATALLGELATASGTDPVFDRFVAQLRAGLSAVGESGARLLVEQLALALQAAVLLRTGSPAAGPFVRSRLGGEHGLAFGTLPASTDIAMVLARALPD
ncbi:acyl-CoA dehydrogenase family protein [Pseudoxanthomonas wuyuanensis]|uniref:Putative acyl-CoA dehydrogenase n=1 Tax=Pseudoxanthomonas wuyuanensis TaxID=1073196 RepID=A0A286CVJ0_9GAMM|nr:acyl-CoA dehydrogenase family protein [Pseudoxanthomonas wuyuanensis]KAF1721306.1 DNA alkylation response protein [Pseudoxanthomonas wuyuanensis]SOD50430.1 putative acyl-CoA dehydrogenase [Pseudoxanthomonas wuyuanensis]